jgi:predicted permease
MYVKNPGVTVTIILTLALGIGANTAIFSLTDALLLRWLPIEKPQELVQLQMQRPDARELNETFSYAIVRAMADQTDLFRSVAGFSGTMSMNSGSPGDISRAAAVVVSGSYYETLGVKPVIGRLLTKNDDEPDSPLVAVISHGYWERQFGGQTSAAGQSIFINGVPVTIVGVSAAGFVGANVGQIADITLPLASLPRVNPRAAGWLGPGNFWLRMVARLKPGISAELARERLATRWPEIAERVISPRWTPDRRKEMASTPFVLASGGTGWSYLRANYKKPLAILTAVVALVLLIACCNIAALQLARGQVRQRETAVRLAIGAGRGRIVRQMLIESTLISLIAAVFGVGLAWFTSTILVNTISAGSLGIVLDLTPNARVLGFTALIAIATGIVFGLAPALQVSANEPASVLRDGRSSGTRSKLIPCLVTVQVAVSLVLLIGANLFIATLQNLQNLDIGFRSDGVFVVGFEDATKFRPELLSEIRSLPGIASASVSTDTPLSGGLWTEPAVAMGQTLPQRDTAIFVGVGPQYFETVLTSLLSGRGVSESDSANSRLVAVINEAFASRYFPGSTPVGQYISTTARVGPVAPGLPRNLEIVGVAKDTSAAGLRRDPYPTVYVPYAQLSGTYPLTLELRVTGSLLSASSEIRTFLQSKLPDLFIEVRPLSAQVEAAMARERMMASLAGGFAVLALVLTCVGLYGLLAYNVARRTKEIGIRIGLGSSIERVIGDVLKSAARLVLLGILVGLPVAVAASRWIQSMLFGLSATDPTAIAIATVLLLLTALLAAFIPARRASHIDPLEALRHE